MGLSTTIKQGFRVLGLNVTWRDRLEERIPTNYHNSPFLPRLYRQTVGRLFHFCEMVDRVAGVEGDFVECGVSIGHGLLSLMLLSDLSGRPRTVYGFDSFAGFPASTPEDLKADGSYHKARGDYASPLDIVTRVLADGRVAPDQIENNLHLVPGFFDQTLTRYSGSIALLHLDCDLYESYKTCLSQLFERVKPGGVIMFDEYEDANFPGARRAVDEFFAGRAEKVIEYNQYGYQKYYVVKQ